MQRFLAALKALVFRYLDPRQIAGSSGITYIYGDAILNGRDGAAGRPSGFPHT